MEILSLLLALGLAFIAYKVLMGVIRIGVIIAIIAVLGYLYSSGALAGGGA
ncbi:hypothetical protein [Erythrobacter sp. JK5]|uniref:hypothetical protein n=1 Tax=Erythrobacter sp. JK5 TaxID=2829500 RepID=UPI001BAA9217|nr:hypothetical protein [Erythrobacter sp. JK5]QUL38628.1 hypothetical protein KDC96_04360 [Erythrobacter sp. JK5]